MNVWEWFLNLLFPRRCLSCGGLGRYICDSCALEIQFINTNICPICRKRAIGGRTHPHCQTKYTLDGLTSVFKYQDPIREAIKRIKYKPFAFDISRSLVALALKKIDDSSLSFSSFFSVIKKKPVLVPVPLHRLRERRRGFNQAEILGKILAEAWSLPFLPDLLIRQKKTEPQYKLEGKERKDNVRGAFNLGYKLSAKSYKLLLFDDVWTTGATMRTCGNLLKRAGARFVWGLTLAR